MNRFDSLRSYKDLDIGPYQFSQFAPEKVHSMIKEFNFTKREFMLELFSEYNKLPFAKCLKNFAKVFNDIYLREIPIGKVKY